MTAIIIESIITLQILACIRVHYEQEIYSKQVSPRLLHTVYREIFNSANFRKIQNIVLAEIFEKIFSNMKSCSQAAQFSTTNFQNGFVGGFYSRRRQYTGQRTFWIWKMVLSRRICSFKVAI